jgi:uncharacterized repeat protein (TIGR03803 family)
MMQSQEQEASKKSSYTVLHTFLDGPDGANPNTLAPYDAGLILDNDDVLYGTAVFGGAITRPFGSCEYGCGVVFSMTTSGKEKVLHAFTGSPDGSLPVSRLLRDAKGNLYGTTYGGGDPNTLSGTVYKVDATGKESVLYAFTGGKDGAYPEGALIKGCDGHLYGTAWRGGSDDYGVVYKLDQAGKETVLYSFTGGADGGIPSSGVIEDPEGNLYGEGCCGPHYAGVVFKVDSKGHESVFYAFTGGKDGGNPVGGLIRDEQGNFYGVAAGGGAFQAGVVFKLDKWGKETVLYNFTGGADGAYPFAAPIRDEYGNFYGTTYYGGDISSPNCGFGCGVVYKLDATGTQTVLYSFTGGTDGSLPYARLVRDKEGNLYGTTEYGGEVVAPECSGGCGVVFKLKPPDETPGP